MFLFFVALLQEIFSEAGKTSFAAAGAMPAPTFRSYK